MDRLENTLQEGLRSRGVHLRLANGIGWEIVALPGMEQYAQKLAHFMGLKQDLTGRYWPRLILTRARGEDEAHRQPSSPLPGEGDQGGGGWTHTDAGPVRHYSHVEVPHVICELREGPSLKTPVEALAHLLFPVYVRALKAGGTPLHAALVEKDGCGVALAGKSGSGKSTCCRRMAPPWRPWCDDLTLVLPSAEGVHVAHPLPTWSACVREDPGTVWETERAVPLAAIFFLERGDAHGASAMGQGEVAAKLAHSAARVVKSGLNRVHRGTPLLKERALIDSACQIAKAVPAYRLCVSKNGRLSEEMERLVG